MNIRPAYCAGQFYPADERELCSMIEKYFESVTVEQVQKHVIGLIVPHAGYLYSGQTAAYGYHQLLKRNYENVVVCSPSHMMPIPGISVFDGDYYETPLGRVPVNKEKASKLADFAKELTCSSIGHVADAMSGPEHSLEVQLPFLQYVLDEWNLIPVVFNEYNWNNCQVLGRAIASVFDPQKTLIVASSDLFHGYDYDQALKTDRRTLESIEAFDAKSFCEQSEHNQIMACGSGPIAALMVAAHQWDSQPPHVLTHTTSADVMNRKTGYIVGYSAVVIEK